MSEDHRAPDGLEHVRAFVNTRDVEAGADELDAPHALVGFLAGRGLAGEGDAADGSDLARAVEMREALRALLAHNAGDPLEEAALETLDEAAAWCGARPRFGPDAIGLAVDAPGVRGGLGRLLGFVAEGMAEGTWARLKVCRRHSCRWAFYDLARNRTGKWCSMAVCGNRTKVERYRARHGSDA